MLLFAADDMVTLAPACSANTAELEIVFSESDDYNIRVRIDCVCIGNENETVSGNHWLFTFIGIVATYRFACVHVGILLVMCTEEWKLSSCN